MNWLNRLDDALEDALTPNTSRHGRSSQSSHQQIGADLQKALEDVHDSSSDEAVTSRRKLARRDSSSEDSSSDSTHSEDSSAVSTDTSDVTRRKRSPAPSWDDYRDRVYTKQTGACGKARETQKYTFQLETPLRGSASVTLNPPNTRASPSSGDDSASSGAHLSMKEEVRKQLEESRKARLELLRRKRQMRGEPPPPGPGQGGRHEFIFVGKVVQQRAVIHSILAAGLEAKSSFSIQFCFQPDFPILFKSFKL